MRNSWPSHRNHTGEVCGWPNGDTVVSQMISSSSSRCSARELSPSMPRRYPLPLPRIAQPGNECALRCHELLTRFCIDVHRRLKAVVDSESSDGTRKEHYMRKAIAAIATTAIVLGGFSVALVVQSPDVASAQEVVAEVTNVTVPAPPTIEDARAGRAQEGVTPEEQSPQTAAALRERIGPFRAAAIWVDC